jgi:hypothetical protein
MIAMKMTVIQMDIMLSVLPLLVHSLIITRLASLGSISNCAVNCLHALLRVDATMTTWPG